uniref:Very-long-chain (3R)-3-hydroxyacyl-CoA dehydratase n=1 Tax=Salarias fasciatus TaxID=181472 RepID=A0A672F4N7_SALFA
MQGSPCAQSAAPLPPASGGRRPGRLRGRNHGSTPGRSAGLPADRMLSFRRVYIFGYNLFQFCGHTWILANTVARFFMFGRDALADTFYSVGFVMSLCQLLSVLELFHIADGIEKARLLPRLVQVLEKNLLLIMVIMLEGIQAEAVVWVQLFLWNVLDLLRYPHELLRLTETPSTAMLWSRYTLQIPLYVLSAASEGQPGGRGPGSGGRGLEGLQLVQLLLPCP